MSEPRTSMIEIVIGSVSSKVLRAARGPVLVCPRRAPNGA